MSRQRRPYMAKPTRADKPAQVAQKDPAPAKTGRPSAYTDELAHEICLRLSSPESMLSICKDEHMPDRGTVARWMATRPDFASAIAHARELQAEAFAEDIIAIADDAAGDVTMSADGKPVVNWESVQRAKLRCDARRWYASKLSPKKYGDKVVQEHTGPDGGPMTISAPMTPAEVAAAIARMLDEHETRLRMPKEPTMTPAQRLDRLVVSGHPLSPELYDATHGWRTNSVH